MIKNDTVEIFISKQGGKNVYFLQNYLEGYHNEKNPLAYQKSFAEYVRSLLEIDNPSYKDKELVVKIDNDWPSENNGIIEYVKDITWNHYWNFDKTHNFIAFKGGNFEDCIFIDEGQERGYKELLDSGSYGYCKSEKGVNDRFQCQRIGAAVLSSVISAGATLMTPFGSQVIVGSAIGTVLADMAINEYNDTFYSKGYIDSYLGDRLAELGALSITSGACAINGAVKSIVDATSICNILGMVAPNTKLASDIGKGAFNEAYSGIIEAYEEMQQYNPEENKGKRPEDIYRESVQKIKDSLDRITPSNAKLRSAIICGVVCGGLGVSTGILFDGGLSATLASLIGGGALGTCGTINGYIYHREITECYEKAEKWTIDLFTGKLFEAEIGKEKSEEHKFQEIIEENLSKIRKAEYILHGIEEKPHAIKGFKEEITIQGERDYDPTEEMYRSRFNSYKSTNSDKSFTDLLQKQRGDNKSKDQIKTY